MITKEAINRIAIKDKFYKVRDLGYVESNRRGDTGIGKTFEDLIGVKENNKNEPDLLGYEIKVHREVSSSFVTLFTLKPNFPPSANKYLRDRFGKTDSRDKNLKTIHTSMFANKLNTYNGLYSFKLINDRKARKIFIAVYSLDGVLLLDKSCGYDYDELEKVLKNKLKNLFYVESMRKTVRGKEFFYFHKATIYESPSFYKFLRLIDQGLIMYDIRIGSYKSGLSYGKPHDHGSGFRILESNLMKLYSRKFEI